MVEQAARGVIVVSDSSPLIALWQVNYLSLLPVLYGRVFCASAVWDEVLTAQDGSVRSEILNATWLTTVEVKDRRQVDALTSQLDRGEAESIALAMELHADTVIVDEHLGRRAAKKAGFKVIGVAGILIAAKHAGRVERVGTILEELRVVHNFRISDSVFNEALRLAGEA